MSLEEFVPDIDSSEWVWSSPEASKEVSEKLKESVKRSAAGIKRTQKDEKKAKKHDILLAGFLVQIIIDKKYDSILEPLFTALNSWYSSNILLGILSLIKIEISDKIRLFSGKEKIHFSYYNNEPVEFNDHQIPEDIRKRINYWIDDIIDTVTTDVSNVKTQELLYAFHDLEIISTFMSTVFSFFINSLNMTISDSKSYHICQFIAQEIEKEIKKIKIEQV